MMIVIYLIREASRASRVGPGAPLLRKNPKKDDFSADGVIDGLVVRHGE
jgi:hypothetical protein